MPNALNNPVHFAKHRQRSPRSRPSPSGPLPVHDDGGVFSIVDQIRRFREPMSVSELAPLLGVSEDVLYRMVRNGDIPQLILPGRKVTRFDPASIVFWLRKHNPILNQVQKAS